MQKFIIEKKAGIIGGLIGAILFMIVPSIAHIAFNGWQDTKLTYFTDVSEIVKYEKISPKKNINSRNSPLKLNSYVTWFSGGWDVVYSDVLRCDKAGFISSDINFVTNNKPKKINELLISPWQFNGSLPPFSTQCYIEATIEVCNERDVCKYTTINSDPIYFD